MQPLAKAVTDRLRGQGMRIILASLEPEGAALAQAVLNQVLAERDEDYGADMINLGYLPGQVVAIRELVSGQRPLSTLNDYKEGLTFSDAQRAGWGDIQNLNQIDMVVNITDNPTTARWWVEQMEMAAPSDENEPLLLAATSALANPFLQPYRESNQLDGLISGINGAAAIEAGRRDFGPARQMLDSQSLAHLFIVILIAAGTVAGWMPRSNDTNPPGNEQTADQAEAGSNGSG